MSELNDDVGFLCKMCLDDSVSIISSNDVGGGGAHYSPHPVYSIVNISAAERSGNDMETQFLEKTFMDISC